METGFLVFVHRTKSAKRTYMQHNGHVSSASLTGFATQRDNHKFQYRLIYSGILRQNATDHRHPRRLPVLNESRRNKLAVGR